MSNTKQHLLGCLGAAVALSLPVAAGALDSGEGRINHLAYVTADDLVSTTSIDYATLPEMTVTTPIRGNVMVQFCAAANTLGSMKVSLRIDATPIVDGIQFAAVNDVRLPACVTGVVPGVSPGIHTFDVQWRETTGLAPAFAEQRTLTVMGQRVFTLPSR